MAHEAIDEAAKGDESIETTHPDLESTPPSSTRAATQTSDKRASPQSNASKQAASVSKNSVYGNPGIDRSKDGGRKSQGNENTNAPASSSTAAASPGIQLPGERLEQYNIAADEAEEKVNALAVEARRHEHESRFDPWKYDPESSCPLVYDSELRREPLPESDEESRKSGEKGEGAQRRGGKAADMTWLHL